MLMSFFRNPSSPIRGTSPARFFVSERMSRLIDECRTYTLRLWDEWLRRAAVLTCVRGVRSNVLPCLIIRWTPRDFGGSRQILDDGAARQKKPLPCRQLKKRTLPRGYVTRRSFWRAISLNSFRAYC